MLAFVIVAITANAENWRNVVYTHEDSVFFDELNKRNIERFENEICKAGTLGVTTLKEWRDNVKALGYTIYERGKLIDCFGDVEMDCVFITKNYNPKKPNINEVVEEIYLYICLNNGDCFYHATSVKK